MNRLDVMGVGNEAVTIVVAYLRVGKLGWDILQYFRYEVVDHILCRVDVNKTGAIDQIDRLVSGDILRSLSYCSKKERMSMFRVGNTVMLSRLLPKEDILRLFSHYGRWERMSMLSVDAIAMLYTPLLKEDILRFCNYYMTKFSPMNLLLLKCSMPAKALYQCNASTRIRSNLYASKAMWKAFAALWKENTIAAAMSFEMAYNLVAEWARPYRGVGAKNSYYRGVSEELYRMSQEEKVEQELQAKQAESEAIAARVKHEEDERQKQLDQLAPQPVISDKPPFPGMKSHAQNNIGMDGCCGLWHHRDFPFNELSLSRDILEDVDIFDSLNSSGGGSEDSSVDDLEPDFKLANKDILNHFEDLDKEISKFMKSESPPFENLFGGYSLSSLSPRPRTTVISSLLERKSTLTGLTDTKSTDPEPEPATKWSSHMQLVTFRATADKIVEDYLECKGVKLYS
ncbi:hypothetical protein PMAA_090040 [Talaromyces marneffei ATCC 18224]|uniref:DUF7168 domain-containing protein n=1 Tax=Talaromyces marneffei (strain ATCC 18224 / CBS 334.59 / QM 7333) TaxID=441960 RepID=B6QEY4_TALMQ|nr:hypothetical protein PMAA_090040 [Talaromyces marneffei ATCC 18224]